MGLFDFFSSQVQCPACLSMKAKQTLLGTILCPNRSCEHFDPSLMNEVAADQTSSKTNTYRNPRTGELLYKEMPEEDYISGDFSIEIFYHNYLQEQKRFIADRRSLLRVNNHISCKVEPTGTRISLSRDRIENLSEIDQQVACLPDKKERRVLTYHAKRGTTSELYETLRQKYPDWEPE